MRFRIGGVIVGRDLNFSRFRDLCLGNASGEGSLPSFLEEPINLRRCGNQKSHCQFPLKLGKLGNPKFPRGPEHLLNHTPSIHNTKVWTKNKNKESKREQEAYYSEFAFERYNKVKPSATRAVGEIPSSSYLRFEKPS